MKILNHFILSFLLITGASTVHAENGHNKEKRVMTKGINHLGLSVSNLDASTDFFVETLGWKLVGGKESYPAKFVSDGELFLTLWQTSNEKNVVPFNRKTNVGLHHLALTVASFEDLDELHERFIKSKGVVIEFSPEFNHGGPTKHMIIREPSGNRIEFAHNPPSK